MKNLILLSLLTIFFACSDNKKSDFKIIKDPNLDYNEYSPKGYEKIEGT